MEFVEVRTKKIGRQWKADHQDGCAWEYGESADCENHLRSISIKTHLSSTT
jgi:hypothetical protein